MGHLVYCPALASGSVLSAKSTPPTHPPYTFVEDKQGHQHLAETDKASQAVLVVRDHLRPYRPLCVCFPIFFSALSKFLLSFLSQALGGGGVEGGPL